MPARRLPLTTFLKMEGPHLSRLERTLRDAYDQVSADLLRAAKANGGPGATVTRLQLEAQRAAIKSYLDRGFDDVEAIIARGQVDAARAASKVVSAFEQELTKLVLSRKELKAVADAEANRAAAGVRQSMQRIQGNSYVPLSDRVYGTKRIVNGQVDRFVDQALARGLSWQDFAKEAEKYIDPKTPGGSSYAARRLARTEINNAFHASSVQRYLESEFCENIEWNKSSSHPENDICDELEDESPYPPKEVPAKPHPHCLCFVTPGLPTEDQFLENLFAGKYDSDAEADDPSPTQQALSGVVGANGAGYKPVTAVDLSAKGDHTMIRDVKRIKDERQAKYGWDNDPNGVQGMYSVFEATGVHKTLPTLVSSAETAGLKPIYRVVNGVPGAKTSREIQDQFLRGDNYAGRGYYGNGSYFAGDLDGAKNYAEGDDSTVIEMFLKEEAKVIRYEDAVAGQKKSGAALKRLVKSGKITEAESFNVQVDPSTWALMNGYDAIYKANLDYTVILNRTALVYKEGVYV